MKSFEPESKESHHASGRNGDVVIGEDILSVSSKRANEKDGYKNNVGPH